MNATFTLLFFAGLLYATAAIAASPLEGDFTGKLRIGTNAIHNGVLHVREIQTGDHTRSLIAVLAAEGTNGQIGETLPFSFDKFFQGENSNHGFFELARQPGNSAVGLQIVALEILIDQSGSVHGRLTSNMVAPDGSLIEANFEFKRLISQTPMS